MGGREKDIVRKWLWNKERENFSSAKTKSTLNLGDVTVPHGCITKYFKAFLAWSSINLLLQVSAGSKSRQSCWGALGSGFLGRLQLYCWSGVLTEGWPGAPMIPSYWYSRLFLLLFLWMQSRISGLLLMNRVIVIGCPFYNRLQKDGMFVLLDFLREAAALVWASLCRGPHVQAFMEVCGQRIPKHRGHHGGSSQLPTAR